jgi:hypothetical protein
MIFTIIPVVAGMIMWMLNNTLLKMMHGVR